MLELSEFDLELALAGAGALAEDIQNEGGAIEHLALKDFFQIPALGGRKFIVENNGVDGVGPAKLGELLGFTLADVSAGDRHIEFLNAAPDDFGPGRGSQFR